MAQQIDDKQMGSVCDKEAAKAVAQEILNSYGKDDVLVDIRQMMIDSYKAMDKGFNPTEKDVETYQKVLDRNKDGKITIEDLEQLAIKYLVGESSQQ